MHPINIISGFRSTGIYPFDRNAIHVPDLEEENDVQESLAIASGLAYIPLYSPVPRQHSTCCKMYVEFAEADLWRFQECYENQYDCTHDPQYNKWLYIHHLEALQQTPFTQLMFSSDDNSSFQLQSESQGTDHEPYQEQPSEELSAQPYIYRATL